MEKNEQGFIGRHYLMKQAFGQDELHEREAVCTRGEPPQCRASCPLHIDMRAVCAHVAAGNFSRGAAVIRTVTPFLHLLSGNCSGMCREDCTLKKLQDGVELPAIVKACALYGGSGAVNRFMIPNKKKKAAVLGDDLCAAACCWELGKRGYEVLWYTARSSLKEVLMDWNLTEKEAEGDLTAFTGFRISVQTLAHWTKEELQKIWGTAETYCISGSLLCTEAGDVLNTAGSDCPGVFAGRVYEKPAWILAEARALALRGDHFLQGVTAEEEVYQAEVFESRLFVTMDGVTGSSVKVKKDSLTRENAVEEAARCIQCQCLECVKGCVYLKHFKRNPQGAIREIYNNLSIVMGNHMANGLINSCDLCGQCKAACPNGFDYADVCEIARHTMVETKKMPPSTHEFALLDQQFSNGEAFLAKPQPGYDTCAYLFFPGCQATAVSPDTVEAAYRDLCGKLSGGVGLMLGCCGAISRWAAREDLLKEAMELFAQQWERLGRPVVICACPTCKKNFDQYTQAETIGIWQLLLEYTEEPGVVPDDGEARSIAIQDACGARGDEQTQRQIREFVKKLGYQVEEIPFEGDLAPCCGFGGLTRYANPEVGRKKAQFAADRASGRILTYCMACRDQLLRAGADTIHLLELAYHIMPQGVPDLSERRYHRLQLREKLLKEIWKEEITEREREQMRPITYAEGAMEAMEERMILKSDVETVLEAYESSGQAVCDQENQLLITSHRLGNVTFWVKFREENHGYTVVTAYSHRMTVE